MMKKTSMIALLALFFSTDRFLLGQQHDEVAHARLKAQSDRDNRDADRWYWQMPNRVISEIGIRPGLAVADVGAGDGYFALRIARVVGKAGRVYANDIDQKALDVLRVRMEAEKLRNVEIVYGRTDDPRLPRASVDLALMVNVIHLIKEKTTFLANLKSGLKPGGRLVIVQWDAEKMDSEAVGWDPEDRSQFTQEATLRWIFEAGYDVIRLLDFLPMQNIYICKPRPAANSGDW
jgi:ubiquinone/menaquinone biosynthesis C-methylase UbiE